VNKKWENLCLICNFERQNCFLSPPDQTQPVLCCWQLIAVFRPSCRLVLSKTAKRYSHSRTLR